MFLFLFEETQSVLDKVYRFTPFKMSSYSLSKNNAVTVIIFYDIKVLPDTFYDIRKCWKTLK